MFRFVPACGRYRRIVSRRKRYRNVREMMLNFDANKNGKIEKGEFVNFMKYAIASKVGG